MLPSALTAICGLVVVAVGGCAAPDGDARPVDRSPVRQADTASEKAQASSGAETSAGAKASAGAEGRAAGADALVLVVSVDGLNPAALSQPHLPAVRQLQREGLWTHNARTAVEQTDTLPNHTSMMTGRRITGEHGHHVTVNVDDGSNLQEVNDRYLPGIFDSAHDSGLRTALYVGKDKFNVLSRGWDAQHGAVDTTGGDDGRDKLDTYLLATTPVLVQRVIDDLTSQNPSDVSFLHMAETDKAGHAFGFMSPRYRAVVKTSLAFVSRIMTVVDRHPSLRRRLTLVVTSDHGGLGETHRDADQLVNQRIPFYVWGAAVPHSGDLYAVNPERRDPGQSLPSYQGPQPIRNADVALLVLRLLGLPALPDTVVPAALDLSGVD